MTVTLTANYTFNGTVAGQTPTTSSQFATKGYVDAVAFASGNLTVGDKGDITVNSASSWTIDSLAVTTGKIAALAVDDTKLASNAVTTAKIAIDTPLAVVIVRNYIVIAMMIFHVGSGTVRLKLGKILISQL